jgi:hypothetical protein
VIIVMIGFQLFLVVKLISLLIDLLPLRSMLRAAGLPQNIVDGIADADAASLPHPYGLLREILSKTLAWQPIPDALQAQAAAEWGKDGLVEIVVVSGFYQIRRDQSGFRYCVAEVSGGRCRAAENLSVYRFARASRVQYFFSGRDPESMLIMRHIGGDGAP